MSNRNRSASKVDRWVQLTDIIKGELPHLGHWLLDEDSFLELRIKARPDGTTLAIAKGFGPDGGPVVAFGSAYGAVGALMAIDATINGNRWRVDTPWEDNGK